MKNTMFCCATGSSEPSVTIKQGILIGRTQWEREMKLNQAHRGALIRLLNEGKLDMDYFYKNGRYKPEDLEKIYVRSGKKYRSRAEVIEEDTKELEKIVEESKPTKAQKPSPPNRIMAQSEQDDGE